MMHIDDRQSTSISAVRIIRVEIVRVLPYNPSSDSSLCGWKDVYV